MQPKETESEGYIVTEEEIKEQAQGEEKATEEKRVEHSIEDLDEKEDRQARHDELFKSAFSHPEVISDLLRYNLPQEVLEEVDLSILKLCTKSFVDTELIQRHSDLIFRTKGKKEKDVDICFIVEHQSRNDKAIGKRMLDYGYLFQRYYQKVFKTKKLPIVLYVLLYTGRYRYTGLQRLEELSQSADLSRKLSRYQFTVIDTKRKSVEEITQEGRAALCQVALKLGSSRNALDHISKNPETLGRLLPESLYSREVVTYFLGLSSKGWQEVLEILLVSTDNKEEIMTAANQLRRLGREEGRQEGLEKGLERGRIFTAQNMLKLQISMDLIKQVTGLSDEVLKDLSPYEDSHK